MQIDLNTLYILTGFGVIVAGAVVWITGLFAKQNTQISAVKTDLVEIKANMNGRPSMNEVRALLDAAAAKVDLLSDRVARLEFEVEGKDRRKAPGSPT